MKLSFLDILVHYKSLNLPGIGKFELDEVSAQVDEQENLIYPPYCQIRFQHISKIETKFSEEIALYLQCNFGILSEEATRIAEEQIEIIKLKVEESSIALLPGLGRIFKAGGDKIHFIPDDIEILKEERKGFPVFELPLILNDVVQEPSVGVEELLVVTDSEKLDEYRVVQQLNIQHESDEAINELLEGNKPNNSKTLWWTVPLSFVLLLLLSIWGILVYGNGNSNSIYKVHTTSSIENRTNIPPLEEELLYPEDTFEQVEGTFDEHLFSQQENDTLSHVETDSKQKVDETKIENYPKIQSDLPITLMESLNTAIPENHCFVIVGAFGQDHNIKKMADALEDYGHRVLIDKDVHLTRVGLLIPCDDSRLPELYNTLKSDVNKDVWIMKKK